MGATEYLYARRKCECNIAKARDDLRPVPRRFQPRICHRRMGPLGEAIRNVEHWGDPYLRNSNELHSLLFWCRRRCQVPRWATFRFSGAGRVVTGSGGSIRDGCLRCRLCRSRWRVPEFSGRSRGGADVSILVRIRRRPRLNSRAKKLQDDSYWKDYILFTDTSMPTGTLGDGGCLTRLSSTTRPAQPELPCAG
jgi:hypothetical protein